MMPTVRRSIPRAPEARQRSQPDLSGLAREADVMILAEAVEDRLGQKADASALVGLARSSDIPLPATTTPMPEASAPAVGTGGRWARTDHTHPRISTVLDGQLDAQGQAVIAFGRTFVGKPALVPTWDHAGGSMGWDVTGWATDAQGRYTGCTIRGYRSRPLPPLTNVSGLLTAVITGVNALVTALTNFDANPPAPNVAFILFVIQR